MLYSHPVRQRGSVRFYYTKMYQLHVHIFVRLQFKNVITSCSFLRSLFAALDFIFSVFLPFVLLAHTMVWVWLKIVAHIECRAHLFECASSRLCWESFLRRATCFVWLPKRTVRQKCSFPFDQRAQQDRFVADSEFLVWTFRVLSISRSVYFFSVLLYDRAWEFFNEIYIFLFTKSYAFLRIYFVCDCCFIISFFSRYFFICTPRVCLIKIHKKEITISRYIYLSSNESWIFHSFENDSIESEPWMSTCAAKSVCLSLLNWWLWVRLWSELKIFENPKKSEREKKNQSLGKKKDVKKIYSKKIDV